MKKLKVCDVCYLAYDKHRIQVCRASRPCTYAMCRDCIYTYVNVYKMTVCPACRRPRFVSPIMKVWILVALILWFIIHNNVNKTITQATVDASSEV